jgi:hypothetical protein
VTFRRERVTSIDPVQRLVATDVGAYEGAGNCYIEFGSGRVAQVRANLLGGPAPVA